MLGEVSHIFFDLDHTLWDFDANAKDCLLEIYQDDQRHFGPDFQVFFQYFCTINRNLWESLERSEISHETLRENRFLMVSKALGYQINVSQSVHYNEQFLGLLPHKKKLITGAIDTLQYLSKKYQLHIISNGYFEVQKLKMKNSGIFEYFGEIITNDVAGYRKPDRQIYDYALQVSNGSAPQAIMIGDSHEADILGAKKAGLKTIFYDEHQAKDDHQADLKINELKSIRNFL